MNPDDPDRRLPSEPARPDTFFIGLVLLVPGLFLAVFFLLGFGSLLDYPSEYAVMALWGFLAVVAGFLAFVLMGVSNRGQ